MPYRVNRPSDTDGVLAPHKRAGRTITLLGPADLLKWHEIERGLGKKLPRVSPEGEAVQEVPASLAPRTPRSCGRFGRRSFASRV